MNIFKKFAIIILSISAMTGVSFATPQSLDHASVQSLYKHEASTVKGFLKMSPDGKNDKRYALSYPANVSFRVPADSKVSLDIINGGSHEYNFWAESKKYDIEAHVIPREILLSRYLEDSTDIYQNMKMYGMGTTEFPVKGSVVAVGEYERCFNKKKDVVVMTMDNGGLLQVRITAKGKNVIKKEWMNHFLRGIQEFDIKQPVKYKKFKNQSVTPISGPVWAQSEYNWLGENYGEFGYSDGEFGTDLGEDYIPPFDFSGYINY